MKKEGGDPITLGSKFWERVKGYTYFEEFGFKDFPPNSDGNANLPSTRAYVILKPANDYYPKFKYPNTKFNPISLSSWVFLRTNLNNLIYDPSSFEGDGGLADEETGNGLLQVLGQLSAMFDLSQVFVKFFKRMNNRDYGKEIDVDKSYIRLSTPTKVKYGAGCRVKQIVFKDNWEKGLNESPVYGQFYDYSLSNGTSSGVATYEPGIGDDEISLKRVKFYAEVNRLAVNGYFQSEHPYNETFFPAPSVGYSMVTTKSLATHYEGTDFNYASKIISDGSGNYSTESEQYNFPSGINTTGKMVNEFYTAKDYPVLIDNSTIDQVDLNLPIPIPPFATIVTKNLAAAQGYKVETNDMHGKPKSVKYFKQSGDAMFEDNAYSSIQYFYYDEDIYRDGAVKKLNNKVDVLNTFIDEKLINDGNAIVYGKDVSNNPSQSSFEDNQPYMLGVDYEMYSDVRGYSSYINEVGGAYNQGIPAPLGIPPIPSFVPAFSSNTNTGRIAVTNKIIHKNGIIKKVISSDNNVKKVTENLIFDKLTGAPVLTSVKNEFEDDIYAYTHKAYYEYSGMDAAYQNSGLQFTLDIQTQVVNVLGQNVSNTFSITESDIIAAGLGDIIDLFEKGDEYLVTNNNGQNIKGTYLGILGASHAFHLEGVQQGGEFDFTLTRSGHRNILTADAGSITALSNPLYNREITNCTYDEPVIQFSNCGSYDQRIGEDDLLIIGSETEAVRKYSIDKVLSSSATVFDDDFNDHILKFVDEEAAPPLQTNNPVNGNQGTYCFPVNDAVPNSIAMVYFDPQNVPDSIAIFNSDCTVGSCIYGSLDAGQCSSCADLDFPIPTCNGMEYGYYSQLYSTYTCNTPSNSFDINNIMTPDDVDGGNINGNDFVFRFVVPLSGCFTVQIYGPCGGTVFNLQTYYYKNEGEYEVIECNGEACCPDNYSCVDGYCQLQPDEFTNYIENPYKSGEKGIWKPQRSYTYIADRNYEFLADNTVANTSTTGDTDLSKIKEDGDFDNMTLFNWQVSKLGIEQCFPNWRLINEITKYDKYSNPIEDKNAIGIYSGHHYSYDGKLLKAAGVNMQTSEFISFDFEGNDDNEDVIKDDVVSSGPDITEDIIFDFDGHTGKKCFNSNYSIKFSNGPNGQYHIKPDTKYIISYWQKVHPKNYEPAEIVEYGVIYETCDDNTVNGNFVSSSEIFEQDWFLVERELTISNPVVGIRISFPKNCLVDDFRVFPADGNMSTNVYDHTTYRLIAQLDENNYASLYYYDSEGNLSIVKKETEEGIRTIQEAKSYIYEGQ